jgi:hypothetical protein
MVLACSLAAALTSVLTADLTCLLLLLNRDVGAKEASAAAAEAADTGEYDAINKLKSDLDKLETELMDLEMYQVSVTVYDCASAVAITIATAVVPVILLLP